jgi:hypothetical protein
MKNKKLIILIFTILICNKSKAQNWLNPILGFGVSKRMSMIRLNDLNSTSNNYQLFTYDIGLPQNYSCISVGNFFNKEKLIVTLENYFTYSEFRNVRSSIVSQTYKKEYRLKRDHVLSIKHPLKRKRRKIQIYYGAGLGIMNLGTNFEYDIILGFDSNYNPIIKSGNKGNFRYFAPRISLGVERYNVSAEINIYSTRDDMHNKNPTIWPEFKLAYSFKPFKKAKGNL